ncbi:hypothetical protein CAOG_08064 [Capsaspora owczarzaki ATCC 30864]|uniref:Splicing factor subunit n=1 Tax=Capsaspora owczarzaki (strain ATCC 30864) TaxID=595528 RepID=A0A0D2USR9_CAPO3|nr:hypothetical protein CAOG_08064 [Capsaspora owczarzaki ATCC 30864]KJE98006.1 hypothetical protein CAOG_008064 [Capsaspora owczarzaki ATCC 30864]|eukprot:XP_004342665.1 hypothetical protein CAOG_08064 [Capsaspora owczarzaki ATCC 30864]
MLRGVVYKGVKLITTEAYEMYAEIAIGWELCDRVFTLAGILTPASVVTVMAERFNLHSQLEHLQSKHVGTGHGDISKFEWLSNQHRDSAASYVGHPNMLAYFAVVENEPVERVRVNLLKKMLQPCGPPPPKAD